MVLKAFRNFNVDEVNLSRIQQNVGDTLDAIISKILLDYNIITGIQMTGGVDKVISHGLGKKLTGWVLIGVSADTRIFDKQSNNLQANLTLVLNSINTATISILVF